MRAVIDTNVLIYDTFGDSVYHAEARELLDSLDEWIIPLIVIYEYVWVMKSLGVAVKETAYKVEEYLQHYKSRPAAEKPEDILRSLEIIQKERLDLSRYNDKIILSIAFRTGRLATFDKRLRKQALAKKVEVLPEKL